MLCFYFYSLHVKVTSKVCFPIPGIQNKPHEVQEGKLSQG